MTNNVSVCLIHVPLIFSKFFPKMNELPEQFFPTNYLNVSGEGKSCIVAMLSAVLAIRGAHVDVISSSSMLARRDAEEWEPFFKMFHLTVGVTPTPGLSDVTPDEQTAKQRDAYQVSLNVAFGHINLDTLQY